MIRSNYRRFFSAPENLKFSGENARAHAEKMPHPSIIKSVLDGWKGLTLSVNTMKKRSAIRYITMLPNRVERFSDYNGL